MGQQSSVSTNKSLTVPQKLKERAGKYPSRPTASQVVYGQRFACWLAAWPTTPCDLAASFHVREYLLSKSGIFTRSLVAVFQVAALPGGSPGILRENRNSTHFLTHP